MNRHGISYSATFILPKSWTARCDMCIFDTMIRPMSPLHGQSKNSRFSICAVPRHPQLLHHTQNGPMGKHHTGLRGESGQSQPMS